MPPLSTQGYRPPMATLSSLFLVRLRLFWFTCPGIGWRRPPRRPTTRHVGEGSNRRIKLKRTAETDDQSVLHVRSRTTKNLPVSVEVVAYAQYGIPVPDDLTSRDCGHVSRIREWPAALRERVLMLFYVIHHIVLLSSAFYPFEFVVRRSISLTLRLNAIATFSPSAFSNPTRAMSYPLLDRLHSYARPHGHTHVRSILRYVILGCCLAVLGVACGHPDPLPPVRDGDIIFQTSHSPQSLAVQRATGSAYSHMGLVFLRDHKGALQTIRDFNLTDPAVRAKLRERYGDNIPLNEPVISPVSMFRSTLLVTVANR
jgi:hypothetical protein